MLPVIPTRRPQLLFCAPVEAEPVRIHHIFDEKKQNDEQ